MSKISIVRGEDVVINVSLKDENGVPYSLTGVTALQASFQGETSCIVKQLGSGVTIDATPETGKLTINLTDTDTSTLRLGVIGFELKIDKGTETRKPQFPDSLEVSNGLCS